jgi:hypothetical protein
LWLALKPAAGLQNEPIIFALCAGLYASGKTLLFADLVIVPTGGVEFRQDVFSTSVGFGDHEEC